MNTNTFIRKYKKLCPKIHKDDASFYFVDEDTYFYVTDVTINNDSIILQLGNTSFLSVNKLLSIFEGEKNKDISAFFPPSNNTYILQSRWAIDENENICIMLHKEARVSSKLETTQEFIKDFGEENKDEGIFTGRITSLAKKMGIKLVYIAYWIYYSLISGKLDVKTIAVATGALGYLLCPFDIINDLLPFIGFSDDATVLVAAYWTIINTLSSSVISDVTKKAKTSVKKIFGEFSDDDIKF